MTDLDVLKRVSGIAALALLIACAGCTSDPRPEIVVYSALDSQFSEPLLKQFETESGVRVRARFDTESTKTVGLTEAIINECRAGNPRCDVFWNNEILHTLRLEKLGLLDVYVSPAHTSYPEMFRSPHGTWHGFAARARVLIVNTDLVSSDDMPTSILDLADDKWKGRAGIAKPLFGTTATHAACLFAVWGDERAKAFFQAIKKNNVSVESGNKQVAIRVARGSLAWGLTDTDDAIGKLRAGHPVHIVYPDSAAGEMGTLFIPNTVALIKGSRNATEARRLIDYLLSPRAEQQLAEGASAQIPLNPDVEAAMQVKTPAQTRAMNVDFEAAAEKWNVVAEFLREQFAGS